MGQRYRRMEDQKPWPGLALNKNFAKARKLKSKLKMKMSELGDVSSKLVQLKRITSGGLGAKLLSDFLRFFGKISYFNAIGSHFARAQSHLKELDF